MPTSEFAVRQQGWMGRRSEIEIERAIRCVQQALTVRDGIVDLTRNQRRVAPIDDSSQAKGFLIEVRGSGRMFAVRPETLRGWITGSLPLGVVLRAIEARGWLIRGADGKATRQVVIPAQGRQRFYCFKPQILADGQSLPAPSKLQRPSVSDPERLSPTPLRDPADQEARPARPLPPPWRRTW